MNILFINKFLYPKGGTETYMMGLGAELSHRGHRVEYFGMEHDGNCVGNRVGAYTKDTDYHTANPVKKVSYALRTVYSTHARRQLRRVLEDLQPQVVHLNNFNYQLTPAVILEIRAWDKATGRHTKILYTAHDYQLLCPNHMLNRPDTMENCTACLGGKYTPCVQHRCMHGSRAKSLLGAAEATLYRKAHTYKEIDCVICCSAFMQSQMEKHPDLAGRTRVLHNFCTVPPRPQVEKEDYVLYFGRYDKEKGIDTLLAAAKALPQLHFVFAGSGTMAEEIQQLPNATDVGFCTGDDLYRRIAAAKCSIYPSVWYENCPYSVMESIALGTPVLGTNIGGMLEHVRQTMAELTNKPAQEIRIQDLLAVDTAVPVSVTGGLAGEFSLEQAVGIASMVKSDRLQMALIAREIEHKLQIAVQVGGAEAEAAILGALTTPGTTRPLAILDLGAGSTDASIINAQGEISATHLAGAGDMVTMIIARELGLEDRYLAEEIKKYPLAKVESLFHLRHEDGSVQFFPSALPPTVFARVCVVKPDELVPLPGDLPLEKVRAIRRSAKSRVFVTNALRALRQVSPTGNIRDIPFVVLVGGSSLDFEIPQLVTDALAHYRLVAGRGNIRGCEGPRNAVASGLLLSWQKGGTHGE